MVHYRGGRAAIDEDVYPDLDEFWSDLTRRLRRARCGALGRARLHLPAVRRHQPRLPQRPRAARDDRRARRRRRAPARALHPPHQRGARGPARRAWRSPRTCAAATSARRGSPRAATTSSPRRCSASSTSTASSWSGTTTRSGGFEPLRFVPEGQGRRARPRHDQARRARDARTSSSAASRRRRSTSTSTSSACRRSAASPRRSRATRSPTSSRCDKLRLVVETAAEVWGGLTARQAVMPWCARSSPPSCLARAAASRSPSAAETIEPFMRMCH